MATEVKVPVLPESVSDAVIASWHKKAGEAVKRDENLVDLETDKVVLEVPAPVDGVLKEIRFKEGDTVTSQQLLAIIEEGAVAAAPAPVAAPAAGAQEVQPRAAAAKAEAAAPASTRPAPVAAAELPPGARFTAASQGIDPSQVEGSGRRGAVTKEDLVNYARSGGVGKAAGARPEERVPMTRIRTRIAERLMQSKNSIAMLTSFNEVNLAKVAAARKELGEDFQKAHGIKLGFMSFFVKAAANALQRFPIINASVDGDDVIYHGYSDISIAVSTEKGLVTPVLRNVERLGFADIEKGIADYAKKARDGKLGPAEMSGGCFSISSLGGIGGTAFTPIINAPEVAILGVSKSSLQPVWDGKQFVPRLTLPLSLSYDHRVIDGAAAARFTSYLAQVLADMRRVLL